MKSKFIILVLLLLLVGCKKDGNQPPLSGNEEITVYNAVVQKKTPNSPTIASLNGVSDEYLMWVDQSMDNLSRDIEAQSRTSNITPANVTIYVLPNCVLSPEQQTPSFLITANNYDGSDVDQDPTPGVGRIYAAEYVIWNNGTMTNSWVICESSNETYVKNVSRYGYEHKYLYDYYRNEYNLSSTHRDGAPIHPLIAPRGN